MVKKINYKLIISVVFPVVVIAYCISQVRIDQVISVIKQSSLKWLFLGLIVSMFNIFIRAYRFHVLISSRNPRLRDLFKVQCLFSMFAYLFPFRSGEISFLYLMKKKLQIQLGESAAMLVVVRVFDYLIVSFLFFVMLFIMWERIPYKVGIIVSPVILILVVIFISLFTIIWKGEKIGQFLEDISKKKWISATSIFHTIMDKLREIIFSIKKIHEKKVYTKIIFLSLLSWITVAISFYVITRCVGYEISYLTAICLTVLLFPVSFIQGVGNLGTHEAEWIPVLMLFGFTQKNAIIASLSSHIVILLFTMLIGGYAWLALKTKRITAKPI